MPTNGQSSPQLIDKAIDMTLSDSTDLLRSRAAGGRVRRVPRRGRPERLIPGSRHRSRAREQILRLQSEGYSRHKRLSRCGFYALDLWWKPARTCPAAIDLGRD